MTRRVFSARHETRLPLICLISVSIYIFARLHLQSFPPHSVFIAFITSLSFSSLPPLLPHSFWISIYHYITFTVKIYVVIYAYDLLLCTHPLWLYLTTNICNWIVTCRILLCIRLSFVAVYFLIQFVVTFIVSFYSSLSRFFEKSLNIKPFEIKLSVSLYKFSAVVFITWIFVPTVKKI